MTSTTTEDEEQAEKKLPQMDISAFFDTFLRCINWKVGQVLLLQMLRNLSVQDSVQRFRSKFGVGQSKFEGVGIYFVSHCLSKGSKHNDSDEECNGPMDKLYLNVEKKGTQRIIEHWLRKQSLSEKKSFQMVYPLGVQKIDKAYLQNEMFKVDEKESWTNHVLDLYFSRDGFLKRNLDTSMTLNLLFVQTQSDPDLIVKEMNSKFSFLDKSSVGKVSWKELLTVQRSQAFDGKPVQKEKAGKITAGKKAKTLAGRKRATPDNRHSETKRRMRSNRLWK